MIDVLVVGAGAAGLTAAIFAARQGAIVHLIERTADGGRKILISGGGRCNVLPSQVAVERFVTDSAPHRLRALLKSWPLADQRAFFEQDLGIPLALEPATGKLFPRSNRARDVRDALVREARIRGAAIRFDTSLRALEPRAERWQATTSNGALEARRVILATGGLSVPATGSDGTGLRLAEGLGVRVNAVYPALTPLLTGSEEHKALSGVSLEVRARAGRRGARAESSGGFLFTHRGYSGPAVLDVSHVAARESRAPVVVQWGSLDAVAWDQLLAMETATIGAVVSGVLPKRLASLLIVEAGLSAERRALDLSRRDRARLVERLTGCPLPWTGTEGFAKAEVTGGGAALEEVDPRTLEVRDRPGLHLCGEMLDAFGPIGGHNFAWAWATGRLAGLAAAG